MCGLARQRAPTAKSPGLQGKLAPSSIDWRLPSHRHAPSRVLQPSHDRVAGWFERDAEQCLSFLAGALSSRSSAALACSLEADHEDARLGTSLALVAADDAALHCMFASLFTSSKALQRRIDTSLQSLFGSEQRVEAFAAAHLRLGGLAGEGHDVKYGSITLLSLSAAHGCLTRLAGQHSPRIDALVVVTDNTVLRHAIASGMLSGVSGPGGSATHSASASASDESAWQAWTELGMLAQAQCLVTSASGFSNIARWWGGQVCVKTLDACIIELLDDNPDIDDLRAQAAYYKRNGHWPPSELDLRIEQLENQSWSSKQAARP